MIGVLSALALTGCGSDSGDSDSAAEPVQVDGRSFTSESVTGHDLVEGTAIALTFDGSMLSASAGCNTMGAEYTNEDSTLKWASEPAMTMMACDQALMDQDQWLADLLTAGMETSSDGADLVLSSGDVTIKLADSSTTGAAPLTGTKWTLDGIVDGDTTSSVPADTEPATLEIADDGTVTAFLGCNQGGGSVEVTDSTLTFGPIHSTKIFCEGSAGDVEAAMLATLDGEVDYSITGSTLVLSNGDQGLMFSTS